MAKCFLSLGSNLGDRAGNLAKAITKLSVTCGSLKLSSPIYETEPWGVTGHPWYLNQCVEIETNDEPFTFFTKLQKIEKEFGRGNFPKLTRQSLQQPALQPVPRTLDIDLLLYGDIILESPLLKIPHPRMHLRRFVLQPLNDIAPETIHPVFKKPVKKLLEECADKSEVKRFSIC